MSELHDKREVSRLSIGGAINTDSLFGRPAHRFKRYGDKVFLLPEVE